MSNTPTSSAQVAEGLNLEAERALFEASAVVGRLYRNNTPGSTEYYEDSYTELAWRVWQEARRTTSPVAEGVALPPLDPQALPNDLIAAGALRQHMHNDGMPGFVLAYDQDVTDRFISHVVSQRVRAALKEAKEIDVAPYAERIRQLERELATFKGEHATQLATKSIDTGEFRELLQEYWKCMGSRSAENVTARIIAHIDGRTAGATQEKKNG